MFSQNVWHHLARVYDGSEFHYYLDGSLKDTKPKNTGNIAKINRIGMQTVDNSNFYGIIDDVRIYSRALSPEEIKALYNSQK